MILKTLRHQFLWKEIRNVFCMEPQLNKTYGSINKPTNQFGQKTKYTLSQTQQIRTEQKPFYKDNKLAQNQSQRYQEEEEGLRGKFDQKKNKQFAFFFNLDEEEKINLIEDYRQRQMARELSIICRQMFYYHEKSEPVWKAIESAFIHFLSPPYDQEKIRSLSKFLSGLGKCKRVTKNYERPIMQILPHSSVQSFVQIVVTMSRLGSLSEQFMMVVQKTYWNRKVQFGPLELNLINYVFAKNGRKVDTTLIERIDSFPLRCIALMLKTFDRSSLITPILLKNCVQPILSRKGQTTFFDLKHIINVYLKYQYFDNYHILIYFDQQFRTLLRNVNQDTLQEIWQYFPQAVNKNKLPPTFVQDVIQSLKKLRKFNKISDRAWKKISLTFPKFTDLQIRQDLQKLIRN